MKKILVLGAGMVGKAIAADLCEDYDVTCADISQGVLNHLAAKHPVKTIAADLSNAETLKKLVQPFDLVVGAVPGFMGFATLKAVIESGKNVVDISFFDANPFLLDELAKKYNVTAIVDCGVAPGLSNILLGYHDQHVKVNSFECLVGGLPVIPEKPFDYKAPFSPIDVIEEYIRPARNIHNGKVVVLEALSEPELVDFKEAGTLESFNTDGLRTLLDTMNIPNMKEKTLRYPGHIDIIRTLRETGFFGTNTIQVGAVKIRPIDFTSALMFSHWKLHDGEEEFTIMRVTIEGIDNGTNTKIIYTLYDRYDRATQTSSMSRTTGYTCTAAVRLVIESKFTQKGICPPEYLGADDACFDFIMNHLSERNVRVEKKVE